MRRILTLGGETLTLPQWDKKLGLGPGGVSTRLAHGWSIERALAERSHADETVPHKRKPVPWTGRRTKSIDVPTYRAWSAMHTRCNNKNTPYYHYYGGRGIEVCERWEGPDGFANFLSDMGKKPKKHTLDRIDNDGNYSQSNCRWATMLVQNRNRRGLWRITYRGETLLLTEWAARFNMEIPTLRYRLETGWDFEKAVTKEVRKHGATTSQTHDRLEPA